MKLFFKVNFEMFKRLKVIISFINLPVSIVYNCGGVKPRPVIEAQEHRFVKRTTEEEESLRPVVGNSGARKCPRRLVREEHPPRI